MHLPHPKMHKKKGVYASTTQTGTLMCDSLTTV